LIENLLKCQILLFSKTKKKRLQVEISKLIIFIFGKDNNNNKYFFIPKLSRESKKKRLNKLNYFLLFL